MKILLIPGNNSLSHVAKCAALELELSQRGHTVLIAVSRRHIDFVRRLGLGGTVLPDIQESDHSALPSLAWFRSPELLAACIQAEIDLIDRFKPDRMVGVFRFTAKISAAARNIPYHALSCGCVMPDVEETLGFCQGDTGIADQALYLDNFFRFTGKRMGIAMQRFGLAPVTDIRELLIGDRTALWDYPQFMPLRHMDGRFHIGPITWAGWPDACEAPEPFPQNNRPLALVSFGTRKAHPPVVAKIVRCLTACGYNVALACGGHASLANGLPQSHRLRCWQFASIKELLCRARLLVCHGGQMTIFESLRQQVPVLVVPSHPEQAHNGVCVERIRCGGRLAPVVAFKGDTRAHADAFVEQPDSAIIEKIQRVATDGRITDGLFRAREHIRRYDAPVRMAELLEGG